MPWRITPALLLTLLLAPARATAQEDGPRPVTDAEREAVALAAAYLQEGPEAWWEALAGDAPLKRLRREDALEEIEVRAGPPAGAVWRLQTVAPEGADRFAAFTVEFPSGLDDVLYLELAEDPAGGFRLHGLRALSEPWLEEGEVLPEPEPAAEANPEPDPKAAPATAFPGPFSWPRILAVTLFVLAGLGLVLAIALRKRAAPAVLLATASLLLATAGAASLLFVDLLLTRPEAAVAEDGPEEAYPVPRLAGLLPLRRALAGAGREGVERAFAAAPTKGAAGEAARLWRAQHALGSADPTAAAELLESIPRQSPFPLANLLRGRLGFLTGEELETAYSYQQAVAEGVEHDGLWLEAAQAALISGFEDRAKEYLDRAIELGSREPDVYYARLTFAVYEGREAQAHELFRTAWRLGAAERREVFGSAPLAALLGDPEIRGLLDLGAVEEPLVLPPPASRPLDVPPDVSASLASSELRLEVRGGRLEVSGGADLAPSGTEVVRAGAWARREQEEALAELGRLRDATRAVGAFSQPSLRRRLESAATALWQRRRWADLVDLTESVGRGVERVPAHFVQMRAAALGRLDRGEDARSLLLALAQSNVAARRTDPGTLILLADLFADAGDYDLAIRLVQKADSQLPFFVSSGRLGRLRLDRQLAASYEVLTEGEFALRFPPDRSPFLAERLAGVLRAERERLGRWIPLEGGEVTEVHLLPFEDFMSTFSGSVEVIGLYDGRIRVPMADLGTFRPEVIAILTHELAHALIADSTGELAPKWLQEGLAQNVEMHRVVTNPMPDYAAASGLLSLPVLEGVLDGFPHPLLVAQAYDQAAWTLRYVEAEHGVRAIRRLLAAFREGRSTEEAIRDVFGISLADFDAALHRWWLGKAPAVIRGEVREYRLQPEAEPAIRWSRGSG